MHIAAPLFALDELIQEPLLMAPPPAVTPGSASVTDDAVSRALPYLPAWPEFAGIYNAATLTPDPFYSAFHDSHPPAALRVARLETA